MQAVIETNNLSKFFGKSRGIEAVNLKVYPGDFFGFIGPNGAGKSTTIRTLLGLLNKTNGQASVFGQEVGPNQLEILRRIGYMPSEAIFYDNMKVKDLIKFSGKLYGDFNENEVNRLSELFRLDINKRVKELSLGNRKKISIINALQHSPELYILDEPTSGLDPLMQQHFWDEISQRNRNGATIFVSSHVLSEVQRYCQKAAIIRAGKIIIEDSIENLIEASIKHVQIQGIHDFSISGMSDIIQDPQGMTFNYRGEMSYLVENLAFRKSEIKDINISQPDMESVFMHYYQTSEEGDSLDL